MASIDIGFKLGRENIRCIILDQLGTVLSRREIPSYNEQGTDAVMSRMAKLAVDITEQAGQKYEDVRTIGIGVPGPLNNKAGMIFGPPNFAGWDRVPLGPRMASLTGKPVYIENDAKATGWAEYLYGAGKGCRNMVAISVGNGVGGAVVINGDLYSGKDGMAGEIGHIPIAKNGRLCKCGNHGCVEAYVSSREIVARFRKMAGKGWRSTLVGRGENVTSADIFAAAANGDPLSFHIVETTGKYLGILAATVMNFLNPDRIVLAGSLMQYGSVLIESMRQEGRTRCFGPNVTVDILSATLGNDASAVGAANLAVRNWEESGRNGRTQ